MRLGSQSETIATYYDGLNDNLSPRRPTRDTFIIIGSGFR
jgi:hypothetical protein